MQVEEIDINCIDQKLKKINMIPINTDDNIVLNPQFPYKHWFE